MAALLLMVFMVIPLWAEEIPETYNSYGISQKIGVRFSYSYLNGGVEYTTTSNPDNAAYLALEPGEPDAAGKPTYNAVFYTLKEGTARFEYVKYKYDSEKNPIEKVIYTFTLQVSGYASRACTYNADGTLVGSDEVDTLTMHVGEWRPLMLQTATKAEMVDGKMKVTWAFMDKGETTIYYVEDQTSIRKQLDAFEAIALGKNYVNATCYEGETQYATAGFPIRIVEGEAKNMKVDTANAKVYVLPKVVSRSYSAGEAVMTESTNIFRCLHGLEVEEPVLVRPNTKEIGTDFYGLKTYSTQWISMLYSGTQYMTGVEYKWIQGEFTRVEEKIKYVIGLGQATLGYAGKGEPYYDLGDRDTICIFNGEITDDLGLAFYYRDGEKWVQSDAQLRYEYVDMNNEYAIYTFDNNTKIKGMKKASEQWLRVSCSEKTGCHTTSSALLRHVRVLASKEVEYRDHEGKVLEELEIGEGKMMLAPWIYIKGETEAYPFPYMSGETVNHRFAWYWDHVDGEFRPHWLKGLAAGEDSIKITYAFKSSENAERYTAILPVHVIDPLVTPLPESTQTSVDFSSVGSNGTVVLISNSGDKYNNDTKELELATTLTDDDVEEALKDAAFGDETWQEKMKGTLAFNVTGKGVIKFFFRSEEGYDLKVMIRNGKTTSLRSVADYGWREVPYDVNEPTAIIIYVVDNNPQPHAPARIAMGANEDSEAKVFIKSIEINPNAVPTGLYTIPTDGGVQKILNEGQILIIRDGKIFNAQGAQVK